MGRRSLCKLKLNAPAVGGIHIVRTKVKNMHFVIYLDSVRYYYLLNTMFKRQVGGDD